MSTTYGSVINDEAKSLLQAKGVEALAMGKEQLLALKKYAEEGNWSWRVAGCIAGLLVMSLSLMSILSDLLSLYPFRAVLNIYLFFFGLAACALEFKERVLTQQYIDVLQREALFITRPYGRAGFYFFLGLLVVSIGGLLNLLVGGYVAFLGMVVYNSSRTAYQELDKIKSSLTEKQVEEKFLSFDKDRTGTLDRGELTALCSALGANLTQNELESALFILDSTGDGKITLEEFKLWWQKKDVSFV